jgi:aryl-alcohol dehydrogenase-like predicted oxidoreductase
VDNEREITSMSSQVPTRPLGFSGLDITPVGFGAWAIGGGGWSFGWGPQDDAASLRVNWIDTAAAYGLGHSEELVGRRLRATAIARTGAGAGPHQPAAARQGMAI